MEVWYGAEQVPASLSAPGGVGSVVTMGIFDGVHRGHQAVLGRVVELSRELACDGERPLAVGQGGDDVRFGCRNSGDATTLEQIGRDDGFEVEIVSKIRSDEGRRWSSTWIRQCLKDGDMGRASQVLGRPHRLRGVVVRGLRRGRELGFPTANLEAATAGVVPPDGVYAGWLVRGSSAEAGGQRLPAAISIGTNPTFDDVPQRTVEAHVLGRADLNLYGEEVGIELVERLRPMLAFDGLDPLLVQMRADIEDTARILDVPVPDPIRPEDVTAQ